MDNCIMEIEVSNGEIIDKLTILRIKLKFITDPEKLANLNKEYEYLSAKATLIINQIHIKDLEKLIEELQFVNMKLWIIEDEIRKKEQLKSFDDEFIGLARQVYITNDNRAELKKRINLISNSRFIEEKSYANY